MVSSISEFKQIRGVLGLTQLQLAERLNMNRVSISKMERGLMPIDIRTLFSLRYLHLKFCSDLAGVPWKYPEDEECSVKQQKVASCDTVNKNKLKRMRKKKK